MSNILVFLQHSDGKLLKSTLGAVRAGAALMASWKKGQLVGLALGPGAGAAADEAAQYGIAQVYHSEDGAYAKYVAPNYAAAAKQAMSLGSCDTFVASATSSGKDFAPRLAAMLEAGQASDIIAIHDDGTIRRPMYAGDVLADIQITTENRVVTTRSTAFAPVDKNPVASQKVALSGVDLSANAGEIVSYEISQGGRPELTDAEIVVSGGRAMQSSENFEKYIFPLADALGAAVGASRAAVDSGYAPNDWQVGQTGKIVAPKLYVAVGISGAIQHLAGMKDSKVIAAINKDPDAPIFEVADYGLVADLYEAVPALTEAIKKARAG